MCHHDHDHDHGHNHQHDGHGHGHANDQGWSGAIRYLRHAPQMWRSEINGAVVDWLAPSEGEQVLDIGAGMGAGASLVASRGVSVVAVEPTPFLRRVLIARRWLQRDRSKLEVRAGAAERLPVEDHSIDAVMAVNAMHHWVDLDRAVAEIARVLGPGGRVVLADEDFDDPRHPDHDRFGHHHGGEDGEDDGGEHGHHGFSMVDADEMGDRFRAAGLVEVEATKRDLAGRPTIMVTATATR
jgi:SAM-dependent methyltransferase